MGVLGGKMSSVRIPGSLRRPIGKPASVGIAKKDASVTTLMTAACLAAASPATIALAQTTPLPPLSVEAKQQKKAAPAPAKKSGGAVAAPAPAPAPAATPEQKGANPYANPDAPYKVEQSASGKLTEPLVNTPRTVTVVPKEVMEDKGARDLRELARSVPGLTIGSAEGGNSYGAFAIRGFKANNDIFVDSIRNPGNVIPDVFSVQQIEIYKGPSGGIAGRSTIGGAINIITKQPDLTSTTMRSRRRSAPTTRSARRSTRTRWSRRISRFAPTSCTTSTTSPAATSPKASAGAVSSRPRRGSRTILKVTLDYYRYRNNAIPDWGVPARDVDNVPVTELGISRKTWVGMEGLDFFKEEADIGTGTVVPNWPMA